MKTIKVAEATELQLDWLVAYAEGRKCSVVQSSIGLKPFVVLYTDPLGMFTPATSWAQAGPLLNQHKISRTIDHSGLWIAYAGYNLNDEQRHMQCDRSELVAGLRCLVALNLGDTVEVPDELL